MDNNNDIFVKFPSQAMRLHEMDGKLKKKQKKKNNTQKVAAADDLLLYFDRGREINEKNDYSSTIPLLRFQQ